MPNQAAAALPVAPHFVLTAATGQRQAAHCRHEPCMMSAPNLDHLVRVPQFAQPFNDFHIAHHTVGDDQVLRSIWHVLQVLNGALQQGMATSQSCGKRTGRWGCERKHKQVGGQQNGDLTQQHTSSPTPHVASRLSFAGYCQRAC
jgi:hypothetical protein